MPPHSSDLSSPQRSKQRTSFLTLPHELRQQIILDAYFNEPLWTSDLYNLSSKFALTQAWAQNLKRAHADIGADVDYIVEKVSEEYDLVGWKDAEDDYIDSLPVMMLEMSCRDGPGTIALTFSPAEIPRSILLQMPAFQSAQQVTTHKTCFLRSSLSTPGETASKPNSGCSSLCNRISGHRRNCPNQGGKQRIEVPNCCRRMDNEAEDI